MVHRPRAGLDAVARAAESGPTRAQRRVTIEDASPAIVAPLAYGSARSRPTAGEILAAQRMAGNAAVAGLLEAGSRGTRPETRGVAVQRLFLPVDRPAPGEEARALAGYKRLIKERLPAVRDMARQVAEPNPEMTNFVRAVKAVLEVREPEKEAVWKVLDFAVKNANELEAKAQRAGVKTKAAPSVLTEAQIKHIQDLVAKNFDDAARLCDALSRNDAHIKQVFAPEAADRAREGMTKIAEQLRLHLSRPESVVIDRQRALDSSGTTLQNAGHGALDGARMTVTQAWAELTDLKRISALVHEASHGAATATSDQAYLGTWTFDTLTPEQQLTNAPHYEAVAESALKLRTPQPKPLSTNLRPDQVKRADPLMRMLLARADTKVMKRRLKTGYVLRALNTSRSSLKPVDPSGMEGPIRTIGAALQFPYAARAGRPDLITATNLDIELLGLFRSWLETIHRTLTNLSRLDVTKDDVVTLSADQRSLTVPLQWLRADDEQVMSFVERLARCLPTIGGWSADRLVLAMHSLPTD